MFTPSSSKWVAKVGHRMHVCKKCARRPKEEIAEIEQGQEIYNFLSQSHISKKNITRLNILKESENTKISEYEALYLKWPRLDHTKNDG